jgi:hypothetical protein
MKTTTLIFILLIGVFTKAGAQKNDYVWLSGYESNERGDSAILGFQFGNNKFNFNDTPMQLQYDSLGMNFDFTSTIISGTSGNLLFYTNGIYVANWLDEKVENGDSLNAGYVSYVWDPSVALNGYRNIEGIISIPDISDGNRYYLIHSFEDSLPGTNGAGIYGAKILVTLVDMSANGGLGQVIFKNQVLVSDSLGDEIQATRHGNGVDWWLLIQKRNSNCFYRILIDSLGCQVMADLACLGAVTPFGDLGAMCFSPDGSKFVHVSTSSGINIYDFDRCTGTLSNIS